MINILTREQHGKLLTDAIALAERIVTLSGSDAPPSADPAELHDTALALAIKLRAYRNGSVADYDSSSRTGP
jgi:hypothetical protein